MSETRYIKVQAYRDPKGQPTCRTKKSGECCFIGVLKLTTPVCLWTHEEIGRYSEDGYLKPVETCPVWSQS